MIKVTKAIEGVIQEGMLVWGPKEQKKAARILSVATKDLVSNRSITDRFFITVLGKLMALLQNPANFNWMRYLQAKHYPRQKFFHLFVRITIRVSFDVVASCVFMFPNKLPEKPGIS